MKVPFDSDVSSARIPWSAAFTKSKNGIHHQTSSKLPLKKKQMIKEFLQNFSRIIFEFFQNSLRVFPGFFQSFSGILPEFLQNSPRVSPEFFQSFFRILPEFFKNSNRNSGQKSSWLWQIWQRKCVLLNKRCGNVS